MKGLIALVGRGEGKTIRFCNIKILILQPFCILSLEKLLGQKSSFRVFALPWIFLQLCLIPPNDKATLGSAPSLCRRRSPSAVGIISLLLNHL